MNDATKNESRIIAQFNRGKLTAKQAQKMIAKAALQKTRRVAIESPEDRQRLIDAIWR